MTFRVDTWITARQLCHDHIGETIRYGLMNKDTHVEMVVTGELKEVSVSKDVVRIGLGGKYSTTTVSEQLKLDQAVVVNPDRHQAGDLPKLRP